MTLTRSVNRKFLRRPFVIIERDRRNADNKLTFSSSSAAADYAALLTGSEAANAATGRFYFRKKTLTYSMVTSPEFGWPKLLTFLDSEDNIVEEFPLQSTPFQVSMCVRPQHSKFSSANKRCSAMRGS